MAVISEYLVSHLKRGDKWGSHRQAAYSNSQVQELDNLDLDTVVTEYVVPERLSEHQGGKLAHGGGQRDTISLTE